MPCTRPIVRRAALRPAALLLMILALGACDTQGSPSASSAAPSSGAACGRDEVDSGGINGKVVDADGNPLDDIFILIQTQDGFRGTARTGVDGVFTAPGVSGDFLITTVDIDYVEMVRDVTVPCGELVDVELVLTPIDG